MSSGESRPLDGDVLYVLTSEELDTEIIAGRVKLPLGAVAVTRDVIDELTPPVQIYKPDKQNGG